MIQLTSSRCASSLFATELHQRQGDRHRSTFTCSRLLARDERANLRTLQHSKVTHRLAIRCKPVAAASVELDKDPEKENSRKYRRTVFTFENWAAHRSQKRYQRHLLALLQSRIVRGLIQPLGGLTALATFVAVYESLREMHQLPAFAPDITFNLTTPFSSTSFALSLLLVFRTNTSYSRWNEARTLWGGITNRSRDLVRQAITYVPAEEDELIDMYKRWTIAYSRTLMCHLREDEDLAKVLEGTLRPEEIKQLMSSAHRPNYILLVLSELIEHTDIVTPERFRMDQNLTFLHDAHGACERLLKTPIPLSYTRHTSRFLIIWLTAMPFTLWKSCGLAMIPATGVLAFLLLAIEEIGVQIEEPFSILPLEAISETIKGNCLEMRSYSSDIKKLVSPVAMRSTSNRNGNGNGSGKKQSADDHAFATPDISSTN
ncbi:hypothetical protein WJX82_004901 [Trebouxia sp. C0006]